MSKYIFIWFVACWWTTEVYANHIIGGEAFFDCINVDTANNTALIQVEFQLYRDRRREGQGNTAPDFDDDAVFGVYRENADGTWTHVRTIGPMYVISKSPVPINDLKCLKSSIDIENEQGIYRFEVTLDIIQENYMIAYQRCCRGAQISNIQNAGEEGSAFSVEITKQGLLDCSQGYRFNELPPSVICLNFPFSFDHSITSQAGDSIVYELCVPMASGAFIRDANPFGDCNSLEPRPNQCAPHQFEEVRYSAPFSAANPLGGGASDTDPVAIDPVTGLLTVTPRLAGEMVMAVCANIYKDSVLLMKVRRDMQFVIESCDRDIDAIIGSNNGDFELLVCGDLNVQFQSLSRPIQFIDEYAWEFDLPDGTVRSSLKDPSVEFPDLGEYPAKLVINPNSFVCIDSTEITVKLKPDVIADFDFDFDPCVLEDVSFMDLSMTFGDGLIGWDWDFGDGGLSSRRNPDYRFLTPGLQTVHLEVTDSNECKEDTTQQFFYTPIPEELAVLPSFFITCTPGVVTFDNLSEPIDSTYEVLWDFGDGSDGPERMDQNPTHVYEEPGDYTIKLQITSPSGCTATQTFRDFVKILDGFETDFTYLPEQPTIQNSQVRFVGESIVDGEPFWDFGDGGESSERIVTHTFQDTGFFFVTYTVTDEQGCVDSITKPVYVSPLVDIAYPNAFTPDEDGDNDVFVGLAGGPPGYMINFQLSIFDRWGKIVFSSSDPTEGWNGRLTNQGQLLPMGVYTYLATYDIPRLGQQERRGVVTLVR